MKKHIRQFLGFFLTLVLTVGMVQYLGYLVRPVETDPMVATVNTFYKLPENSVEVLAVGSSHMHFGLDANTMYEEYGIGIYNYGCEWQQINTTSLFLQDALRTQKPKVVIIEISRADLLLQDSDVTGEIYYTKPIPDFPGKREYLKQCFGDDMERYLSYYMPLAAFHDNWINLSKASFMGGQHDYSLATTMGSCQSDAVTEITLMDPKDFTLYPFPDYAVKELDKMVSFCQGQGIEVVLYMAPVEGSFFYHEAAQEYAEANDCLYVELFSVREEAGIDGATDFWDVGHMNTSGAIKAARWMGKVLKENYELTDMRQVEGNPWEQKDWAR